MDHLSLEQTTAKILNHVSETLDKISPELFQDTLGAVQVSSVISIIEGFVGLFISFGFAYVSYTYYKWNKDYKIEFTRSHEGYDFGCFAFGVISVIGFFISLFAGILNEYTWSAIYHPAGYLVMKILLATPH